MKTLLEKLKEIGIEDKDLAEVNEAYQKKLDEQVSLKLDEKTKELEADYAKKLEEGIASETTKLEEAFNTQLSEKEAEMLEALDAFLESQINEKISEDLIEAAGRFEADHEVVNKIMEVFESTYVRPNTEGHALLTKKDEDLTSKVKELDEAIAEKIALKTELDLVKKAKLVSEKTANISEANKKRIDSMFEGRDYSYTEKNLDSFITLVVEDKKPDTKTDLNETNSVVTSDDKLVTETAKVVVESKKPDTQKSSILSLASDWM